MASSPANPNPQNTPFDVHKFFKPTTPPPPTQSQSPYPTPTASYPQPATAPFFHQQYSHLYMPPPSTPINTQQQLPPVSNMHHQRSLPYPTAHLNLQSPRDGDANAGNQILALINNNSNGSNRTSSTNHNSAQQFIPQLPGVAGPVRVPSCKIPRGRRLAGDHVVYDVDARMPGEMQPQLEVNPITKYLSDPQLVLGRQIAVNKDYICYALKGGNIRILNITTALRALFRGHSQRITDMAFFAEDVHLLASVSVEGQIFVWKISEGSEEEDKPEISGAVVIAVQILGEEELKHPQLCWHCHKQEILIVGIGKRVLRIDTTKVGKGETCSADSPLQCPVDKLIDGIQLVGKHDGEVTDLSMCQWMTSRLVSASTDGTIKIWQERKMQPLAILRPHDGRPVNSVRFLTSPARPDHIVLMTGGPLNREVKIWASASDEGWLLPSDAESWNCTQILDLKGSAESRIEDTFFNQVVALSQPGLLLLANTKRNAIYVVHLEYGRCPAETRMDYVAEFSVTMPILSFTGTDAHLDERIIKVYCVQTQAIQQYSLDLCQCLPHPLDNVGVERLGLSISHDVTDADSFSSLDQSGRNPAEIVYADSGAKLVTSSTSNEAATSQEYVTYNRESKPSAPSAITDADTPADSFDRTPLHSNNDKKQAVLDYSAGKQRDEVQENLPDVPSIDDGSRNDEKNVVVSDGASVIHNQPTIFKHPTHLVTPSEILMAASSSETTNIIERNSDRENYQDIAVKVVGEARSAQNNEVGSHSDCDDHVSKNRENVFSSQVSGLSIEMARECFAVPEDNYIVDEEHGGDAVNERESDANPSHSDKEKGFHSRNEASMNVTESPLPSKYLQSPAPTADGKRQKGKISQVSDLSSPSSSCLNLADSYSTQSRNSSPPSADSALPQISTMQETLNQLLTAQKEMQKQMSNLVSVTIAKEGKRVEAALGRTIEKALKFNTDALWARFQEETANEEKLLRDHTQQVTSLITNFMNKDLHVMFEKVTRKEFSAILPALIRSITPAIEKTIPAAIAESFQRGVGDKAVNQLEKSVNSKLEATVARQIQSQFQTSGRQALQDSLKSSLEASVIPAFEKSCKAMFDQVDATFQKGMVEHANAAQQHFDSTHSQLANALRASINTASSMAQTLSGELAEGQRKVLALAAAGANAGAVNPTQLNNGPLGRLHEKVEVPLDPKVELSRLIGEHKYEEAFTAALQRSDVSTVAWLCSQVDLHGILGIVPLPLSQGVLLSLLQQLACDINSDTSRKLGWMTDVAAAINPADEMMAVHMRPIVEQVHQILLHHRNSPSIVGSDLSSLRLLMHVINSMLMSCK